MPSAKPAESALSSAESTIEPTVRRRDPLTRAFEVLRKLAESEERARGVRELAGELGWPPSTVHRVLQAMEQDGFVSVDAEGRYGLGVQFLKLAYRATTGYPVWDSTIPALTKLVAQTRETALLGIYDRRRMEMTFAAAVESEHPVRYVADLRSTWYPIYAGASGLAILSFLPDDERATIIKRKRLRALTDCTITNPGDLEAETAKVRERGYAVSEGQRLEGAAAVAAPVWDSNRRVFGDVFVTVPIHRFRETDERALAAAVIACANSITERLGGT